MKGMNLAIRSEIHSILSEALEPYFEQHYEDCWLESPINLDNLVIHVIIGFVHLLNTKKLDKK